LLARFRPQKTANAAARSSARSAPEAKRISRDQVGPASSRPRRHRQWSPDAAIRAALRHPAPLRDAFYATMPVETTSMQHDTPCGAHVV
jgi:hypothetical protein